VECSDSFHYGQNCADNLQYCTLLFFLLNILLFICTMRNYSCSMEIIIKCDIFENRTYSVTFKRHAHVKSFWNKNMRVCLRPQKWTADKVKKLRSSL
jgi:hypothetical protein